MSIKKSLVLLLILSVTAFSTSIFADIDFDLNTKAGLLSSGNKDKALLRDYVKIGLIVDVNGYFRVVSVAQSGSGFNKNSDVIDSTDSEDEGKFNLHLRNLYLEKTLGPATLQAGAIQIEDYLGMAVSKDSTGWIDGGRLTLDLGNKTFVSVSAGRINPDEPSVFLRDDFDDGMSYVEIQICTVLFEKLMINTGVEKLDDKTFFKAITRYDLEFAAGRVITLISEALISDDGEQKLSVGFTTDIVRLFSGKESTIRFNANYVNTSNEFGPRDDLVSSHYSGAGNIFVLGAKGAINKKKTINWFVSYSQGLDDDNDEWKAKGGIIINFDTTKNIKKLKSWFSK